MFYNKAVKRTRTHICHLKIFSSHIKKQKEIGETNFNNIFNSVYLK